MKTFRDKDGREWTIDITVGSIKRVKDLTGVDLTKVLDKRHDTDEQLQDLSTLFGVICAAIQPQLVARNVTPEQLGDSMDEPAAEDAAVALYEAVIDFFREPKRSQIRQAFQQMLAAARKVQKEKDERMRSGLESLDFEKVVRATLAGRDSATNSPAPLASTPAT